MKAIEMMEAMVDNLRTMVSRMTTLVDGGDLDSAEQLIHRECARGADEVIGACISDSLKSPKIRQILFETAEAEGWQLHHVQSVSVRLNGGTKVVVESPWYKRKGKAGRRKRGPKQCGSNRKGCHLGLERLGIDGKNSPVLLDRAVRLAATMPSFKTASDFLKAEGAPLSAKAIRDSLAVYGELSYEERAQHALGGTEMPLAGMRIQLSVDGGRARERKAKAGRVPDNLKRRGFETPWREAMIFTLFVIDENGVPVKDFPTLIDGVVDGESRHADFLRLLREYLIKSGASSCQELVLVCDGAPWHWKEIPETLIACGINAEKITQVLDYTHAKQNVHELVDLCACHALATMENLLEEAKGYLFAGDIHALSTLLCSRAARGQKRRVDAKLKSYFVGNAIRLTYAQFADAGVPIGSGAVESAIRRVLNLRIKAPGSFWIPANAEAMIFVRANLLYGRWPQVQETRREVRRCRFSDSARSGQQESAA